MTTLPLAQQPTEGTPRIRFFERYLSLPAFMKEDGETVRDTGRRRQSSRPRTV